MYTTPRFACAAVLASLTCSVMSAQNITAAHSGTVHYFEGAVTIDGTAIEAKKAKFNSLRDQSVLATGQGRAEILLTPGVFLRIGENTSIKMLDSRLLSTRVELLSGTAMVESDDPDVSVKDPAVTIVYKAYDIQPVKFGLFELSSSPSELKVFKGQADVAAATNRVVVKEGHMLSFAGALLTSKFEVKSADDLYLWTRDRGAYLSAANMASAHSIASGGMSSMGGFWNSFASTSSRFGGGWYYNNFLDMYTYMPYGRSTYWSPFGYGWYSPYSIGNYYNPGNYYWYGGGGAPTGSSTGQAVNSPTQVSRFGVAVNHPTLASPVRNNADGSPALSRGGFSRGGPDLGGGFNAASASNAALSRGGFNSTPVNSAPSYSAPAVSVAPVMSSPAASAPAPTPRAH